MSYAEFAPLIARASAWAGIPAGVLSGVLGAESNYEMNPPNSSAGAIGPAQMMPDTAAMLNIDPTKPEESVYGAAYLLRQGHDQFGSWPLAVAAYNAGPGAVQQYGGIPPYAETQSYVAKVLGGQNYDQPAGAQTRTTALGSAQSAAIADSVRNGLLGGAQVPNTTTNAGSAATAAPIDVAGGTGIEAIMQQIAQMMAQMRGGNSAIAGIMDPRLLTGTQSTNTAGYIPTLAKQQFDQTKMEADRNYALDVDKYGLSVAQFNYTQRMQTAQLSLDTLTKMATLSGPKDQIAYQYALKGLAAPAPDSQTNVSGPGGLLGGIAAPGAAGVNQPYTSSLGVARGGGGGGATLPQDQALAKASSLSDLWNAGKFDEFHAAGGSAPTPAVGWGAANPSGDQHPEVPGVQGAQWTPDTYTDSPYTAGVDSNVQHADLGNGGSVSWDPNAPGNGLPGYAQGGLLEGVAGKGKPGREFHIEDRLYGDETPEQPEPLTPDEIQALIDSGDAAHLAGGGMVAGRKRRIPSQDDAYMAQMGSMGQMAGGGVAASKPGLLDDVDAQGALIAAVIRHLGDGPSDQDDAPSAAAGGGEPPAAAVVGDIPGKVTGGEEIARALPPEDGRSRFEIDPLSRSKDPAEVAAKMPPALVHAALGGIFGDTNINSNGTGGPGVAPSGAVYGPQAIGGQPAVQAVKNPGTPQPKFTGFAGGISNPDYGLLDLPSAPSGQVLENLLPSQMDALTSAYQQGAGVDMRDILAQSQAASPIGHGRYGDRGRYGASMYGD